MTTYSELITLVEGYITRDDLTADIPGMIRLAENRLNRELVNEETDESLTGVAASAEIDVSSLNVVDPVALWLQEASCPDQLIPKGRDFEVDDTSGKPRRWELVQDTILFDRPLDQAYTFRFRLKQKFAYAGSGSATNWLLTEHADIYLAAVLVWGGVFIRDPLIVTAYAGMLNDGLASVRSANARKKRSVSNVDPALSGLNHRQIYGVWP